MHRALGCLPFALLSIQALPVHAGPQISARRFATPVGPRTDTSSDCTDFEGSGGPNGDFDWVVHTGDVFFFDTTETLILGGPGGLPTTMQKAVNGVVDVRNLTIEPGGEIRVQGPNSMHILATGDVVIRGRLNVSGFQAHSVSTLNTGNIVESGASGAAGGGKGGNANVVTTNSTPRGGTGQGPFGELNTGGEGGETGYAPANLGKDARRPGGGGGGRFARDQGPGLAAGPGTNGSPLGTGAVTGMSPALGGAPGAGPFTDGNPNNDFFGTRPVRRSGGLIELLRGELPGVWAGYGGGGGGNADPASTFPTPSWNFASDEKGGGAGGGGGALHVQALGRIVFGTLGEIKSDGGHGGNGENTNFLDHVGGTGGSGSGGHVVLETATLIDFTDGGASSGAFPRNWLSALGGPLFTGPLVDVNACCRTYSNGGPGGPGVIQLHVPDPLAPPGTDALRTNILVPGPIATLRNPLDAVASPAALPVYPTFCLPAQARSHWIPLERRLGIFVRAPGPAPGLFDEPGEANALAGWTLPAAGSGIDDLRVPARF